MISLVLVPLCVFTWTWRLILLTRHIVWADVILQSGATHGFGTTFQSLEVIRRLHQRKNILYFAFFEPENHNRYLGLIFGEKIRFFSIRRPEAIFHEFLGRPLILPPRKLHDTIAKWLNKFWFPIFAKKSATIYDDPVRLFDHLYELPEVKQRLPNSITRRDPWNIDRVQCIFIDLFEVEHLHLPDDRRRGIHAKIEEMATLSNEPIRGLCGFWLKKDPPHEKSWKDGAPVENYEKALECLIDAGYVVLWHGDRPLPENYRRKFRNRLLDAEQLNVQKEIFNLFVPTESDIFIGDSGPGLWMACCNGAPTLGLNLYPIGTAFRINWAYFKHIVDGNGERVPYDKVFEVCPPEGIDTPEDWRGVTMTANEIRDAVAAFVAAPVAEGVDPYSWAIDLLPEWPSLKRSKNGRLSPAWIKHNRVPLRPDTDNSERAAGEDR
tara:strand:+ start:8415 stop:9725 length:1311 start_codon:yes stop_codon:yes gene_type:complete